MKPRSSAFEYRRASDADLAFLLELERSAFPPDRRESPGGLRGCLRSASREVWLLEEAGRSVGALILQVYPRCVRIFSLAVEPDVRGRGAGRALLEWAVRRTRELGRSRLRLEVDPSDRSVHDWYRRAGFRRVADLPDYYAPGRSGRRLERNLEGA